MENEGPARTEQFVSQGFEAAGNSVLGPGDKERGIFSAPEEIHIAETNEVMTGGGNGQNMGEQALKMSEMMNSLNKTEMVDTKLEQTRDAIEGKIATGEEQIQSDLSNVADAEGNDISLFSTGSTEMLNKKIKDGDFFDNKIEKEFTDKINKAGDDLHEANNIWWIGTNKFLLGRYGRRLGDNNDLGIENGAA